VILPRAVGPARTLPLTDGESDDPLASPHIRALALEIAYRLRPFCGHLPEGELIKLVTRMAVAQQASTGPFCMPHRP
jgi:hypothetical protein